MNSVIRLFVSVGTHEQPFQRLLDHVADSTGDEGAFRVVYQYGVANAPAMPDAFAEYSSSAYFTPSQMRQRLDWCDFFITQASPGNIFSALAARRWPLVLGRRRSLGEHVDDHQVRFAEISALRGLCNVVDSSVSLRAQIDNLLQARSVPDWQTSAFEQARRSALRSAEFRTSVWPLILT